MNTTTEIIQAIIRKQAVLKDYPKPGVNFISIERLLSDGTIREKIAQLISQSVKLNSVDGLAPIASRGYIPSGMLASQQPNVDEVLIQKVKVDGDPRFSQLEFGTEYSKDKMQVAKGTIKSHQNYLVIDDLAATGGSLLAAIELIRQNGGTVTQALVLSELVDFDCRSKLEAQGVELVSLLKLTEADLLQLMQLQTMYQDLPAMPVGFKLTHHQSAPVFGEDTEQTIKIHLGSSSELKYLATNAICQSMLAPHAIEVVQHNARSDVPEQPFDAQTATGANNRIQWMAHNVAYEPQDILVSIENGLRFSADEDKYYDFVCAVVKYGDKQFQTELDCCEVPKTIVDALSKDEAHNFRDTWGDYALAHGMADNNKDPHASATFGGVSREIYIQKALSQSIANLKLELLETSQIKDKSLDLKINRWLDLTRLSKRDEVASSWLSKTSLQPSRSSRPINLYNQGVPKSWSIATEKLERNQFKIFQTGDPFAVISPRVNISSANINIHLGLNHSRYNQDVLIHEVFQLCRCVYEHGARSITVAVPEQFHPLVHYSEFNSMLMHMFKAIGVDQVYYYDDAYTGKLDEDELPDTISLRMGGEKIATTNYIDPKELKQQLKLRQAPGDSSTDVTPITREAFNHLYAFEKVLSLFSAEQMMTQLLEGEPELRLDDVTPNYQPHILLSCSSNKPLAEKIANSLRKKGELVAVIDIEGSGRTARIPVGIELADALVTIVQSTHPDPDNITLTDDYKMNGGSGYFFEALHIAHQARMRGAASINLVNPYQFSARSDKAEKSPDGKTGSYVQLNGQLLRAAGVNHVISAECHDVHTMSGAYTGAGMRGTEVAALTSIISKLALDWVKSKPSRSAGKFRLVTPDAGAAKRTKALTKQLQVIMGDYLSDSRILGDKQRDSHDDASAHINSLNSDEGAINPIDRYIITDDETATGTTLCQAVVGLKQKGAENISVIVVHNNLPLNWLERQLCLARFLSIGVQDLNFSDSHEMGKLALNYDDMIATYVDMSGLSQEMVEQQVATWFQDKVMVPFASVIGTDTGDAFALFKTQLSQLNHKVHIHSLADDFANKIKTMPFISNPFALLDEISKHSFDVLKTLTMNEGFAAIAGAIAYINGVNISVESDPIMVSSSIISNGFTINIAQIKTMTDDIKERIASGKSLDKILAIGKQSQAIAGALVYALAQEGIYLGMVAVNDQKILDKTSAAFYGRCDDVELSIDRNAVRMGDYCIALLSKYDADTSTAISVLAADAKIRLEDKSLLYSAKASATVTRHDSFSYGSSAANLFTHFKPSDSSLGQAQRPQQQTADDVSSQVIAI